MPTLKFVDDLDAKGVPFENPAAIIRTAKQFCLDMGRQGGSTTWKVKHRLSSGGSPDVLPERLGLILGRPRASVPLPAR